MGTVDIFSEEVIAIIKMFVIILPCLLAAANSLPFQFSSFSKPSVRVPNPCNTQEGTQCIFPFTYLGVEYYKCTYAASPVPWCAIMELPTPPAPPQGRTWPGAPPTLPLLASMWKGTMDIVHPLVQGLRTIQQLLHLQQPLLLLHQVQQLQFQQLLH